MNQPLLQDKIQKVWFRQKNSNLLLPWCHTLIKEFKLYSFHINPLHEIGMYVILMLKKLFSTPLQNLHGNL